MSEKNMQENKPVNEEPTAGYYVAGLLSGLIAVTGLYLPILKSEWIEGFLFRPGHIPWWFSSIQIVYMMGIGFACLVLSRVGDPFTYRFLKRYLWFRRLDKNKSLGKVLRNLIRVICWSLAAAVVYSFFRENPGIEWFIAWMMGIWGLTGILAFGIDKWQTAKAKNRGASPDSLLPH